MRNLLRKLTIISVCVMCFSSLSFAKHAVKLGAGLPVSIYGEYEYKMLMNQVGFYVNYGITNGTVSDLSGDKTAVDLNAWSVGAKYRIPLLGLYVRGGYASMTADGSATDAVTTLPVNVQAKVGGIDVAAGMEYIIGPVLFGIDGGVILAKPDVTASTVNGISGTFNDFFNISKVPHVSIFAGVKF